MHKSRGCIVRPILMSIFLLVASTVLAGFASNEVYLASIGRGGGSGGAQFYSTVWVTNLSSSATVHFTFFFLKDGQSNLSGAPSFNDTLAPGQTKLYENVTETKLNLPGQFGAARITADGEIFASERVYNLESATANLGTSEGLFFAAVPKSFAIGLGDSASVQGINQGAPTENMRTNFDLVETTGNSCKVHVTLLDQSGASKGATDVNMVPYGHVKENVQALLGSVNAINDRIVATVTSGSGHVILAGEQLANTSQDSSGFEMSFKDSLLGSDTGGNCGICVTALNGLTGAVTIAAGSNVTVNKSGQTITIASSGDGGDLTLPSSGTASSSGKLFSVTNSGTGDAVYGESDGGDGVSGISGSNSHSGVHGTLGVATGVSSPAGVWGDSDRGTGVAGTSNTTAAGVFGSSSGGGAGVYGVSPAGYGVYANGNLGATGTKSFVEPHPTDASKEIRYVCLEGPEAGTYFRGTARIVKGFATIDVPDHFRMVTAADTITIQLTPIGAPAVLYCVKKSLDQIVVQSNVDVQFDYMINGIRKAFPAFEPISVNRDFVPKSPGDDLGIAALPAESVRRLKASGILRDDGSVNLETARRLGWDRQESWERAKAADER